jgi:hypothetical protein
MEVNVEKTKVMRFSSEPSPLQIMIGQNHLENVEYFSYLGSLVTYDARCTGETKSRIDIANSLFSKKNVVKCYIWSLAFYGDKNWTLRRVDQKYL